MQWLWLYGVACVFFMGGFLFHAGLHREDGE